MILILQQHYSNTTHYRTVDSFQYLTWKHLISFNYLSLAAYLGGNELRKGFLLKFYGALSVARGFGTSSGCRAFLLIFKNSIKIQQIFTISLIYLNLIFYRICFRVMSPLTE